MRHLFGKICTSLAAQSLLWASPAAAWGHRAHETVAWIAQAELTPTASAEVHRLLTREPAGSLAAVSRWADAIRPETRADKPYHSVHLPLDHSHYDPAAHYCARRVCIVKAIEIYRNILADRSRSDAERLVALKYLVHLVGDVHQPLHATAVVGHQWISFEGKLYLLHKLWDSTWINLYEPAPREFATKLLGGGHVTPSELVYAPGTWAEESRDIVRDYIYRGIDPKAGNTPKDPIVMPKPQAIEALPIIEQRLRLAGLRLAKLLNDALS